MTGPLLYIVGAVACFIIGSVIVAAMGRLAVWSNPDAFKDKDR